MSAFPNEHFVFSIQLFPEKHFFVSDKCEVEDVAGGRPLQTRIITLINISRGAADVIIAIPVTRVSMGGG